MGCVGLDILALCILALSRWCHWYFLKKHDLLWLNLEFDLELDAQDLIIIVWITFIFPISGIKTWRKAVKHNRKLFIDNQKAIVVTNILLYKGEQNYEKEIDDGSPYFQGRYYHKKMMIPQIKELIKLKIISSKLNLVIPIWQLIYQRIENHLHLNRQKDLHNN